MHEGGLAGAGRTHDGKVVTYADLEVYAAQRLDGEVTFTVDLGDALELH